MNTNNDGWIKMSERKPVESDMPIWGFWQCSGRTGIIENRLPFEGELTHWKPAVLPAPPAKELTQGEKDRDAYIAWAKSYGWPHWKDDASPAWHAALAYRDAQNREDLRRWRLIDAGNDRMTISYEAYKNLAARCGLDT